MLYDGINLNKVLSEHELWLHSNGYSGSCAIFSLARLDNINFCNVDLSNAVFNISKLYNVSFIGARLYNASFISTSLFNCMFEDIGLGGARFINSDINVSNWDLDMTDTIMCNTEIMHNVGANIGEIKYQMNCPDTGAFVAWKKAYAVKIDENDFHTSVPCIIKLLIPEDAKRLSATTRKCRSDKAIVLEVQDMEGKEMEYDYVKSIYDFRYMYKAGDTIYPTEPFDTNRWHGCSSGIHFYINRIDAVKYPA